MTKPKKDLTKKQLLARAKRFRKNANQVVPEMVKFAIQTQKDWIEQAEKLEARAAKAGQ
jgi:hypothetical protein